MSNEVSNNCQHPVDLRTDQRLDARLDCRIDARIDQRASSYLPPQETGRAR
jgi:hypothetical protein